MLFLNVAYLCWYWPNFLSDLCDGSEDRIEYPSIEEYIYSGKLPTLKRVAMASIIEHVNKNLKNVEDFHEAFKLLLPKPLFALICKFEDHYYMHVFENYIEPTIIYNYDGYS